MTINLERSALDKYLIDGRHYCIYYTMDVDFNRSLSRKSSGAQRGKIQKVEMTQITVFTHCILSYEGEILTFCRISK